jgi:pyruvate dehydrogenase kinase 2/3/4
LVYGLYSKAFDRLRQFPTISTLDQNNEFCRSLEELLQDHLPAIPHLAAGMIDCRKHLPASAMDKFIEDILRTRIGRRVLAEQHIALSQDFRVSNADNIPGDETDQNERIGIVRTRCNAGQIVEKCVDLARMSIADNCGKLPNVIIDGDIDAHFMYIPDHIEYILYELLKNSMSIQASIGNSAAPVAVSIFASPGSAVPSSIEGRHSHHPHNQNRVSCVIFRVSDQAGGFSKRVMPHDFPERLWSFHHQAGSLSRVDMDQSISVSGKVTDGPHSSLRIGLQLARVFACYWGGDITVMSMAGYGSDVYVKIVTSGEDEEMLTKE